MEIGCYSHRAEPGSHSAPRNSRAHVAEHFRSLGAAHRRTSGGGGREGGGQHQGLSPWHQPLASAQSASGLCQAIVQLVSGPTHIDVLPRAGGAESKGGAGCRALGQEAGGAGRRVRGQEAEAQRRPQLHVAQLLYVACAFRFNNGLRQTSMACIRPVGHLATVSTMACVRPVRLNCILQVACRILHLCDAR